MKEILNKRKGITLVALVITIIILLILAGISILALTNQGLFKNAQKAKETTEEAQRKETALLDQYESELNKYVENGRWDGKVNKPELMTGMSAIKFTDPTDSAEGAVVDTTSSDAEWYSYEDKKWANAKTEDGSMWVWIPRYAYRIHKENGIEIQKFDIVFLVGLTDNYYDENGKLQTAQRQTSEDQTIVTNGDTYTVHPAFTNESSINYANGGWDKELAGIWVAKFEAGYASGNNSAPVKASSVNYSQMTSIVPAKEAGTTNTVTTTARNWLDGEYSIKNGTNYEWKDGKETAIKYPTFQGLTYSMNYINMNDAFKISRVLAENENIYGFSNTSTDSHLMKNSEWGAVAYLSDSEYGLNGNDIILNNVTLSNSIKSVYGVTGCAGETYDGNNVSTTIEAINNKTQEGIYTWREKKGILASSTGTIYGIYDLTGGTTEHVAGLINNENEKLETYANYVMSELKNGKSTKYITVYPHDNAQDNVTITNTVANLKIAKGANYIKNTKIYGDGIRETSTEGIGNTSWYGAYSYYAGLYEPLFIRGGSYGGTSDAGLFAFAGKRVDSSICNWGFRVVLVSL